MLRCEEKHCMLLHLHRLSVGLYWYSICFRRDCKRKYVHRFPVALLSLILTWLPLLISASFCLPFKRNPLNSTLLNSPPPIAQRLKLQAVNDQIEVLEAQLNSQIKNNEQLIKIIRNINNADYFKSFGDSFNSEFEVGESNFSLWSILAVCSRPFGWLTWAGKTCDSNAMTLVHFNLLSRDTSEVGDLSLPNV